MKQGTGRAMQELRTSSEESDFTKLEEPNGSNDANDFTNGNDGPAAGLGAVGHLTTLAWSNTGRRALSPVARGENVVENAELSSQLDVSSHVSGQVWFWDLGLGWRVWGLGFRL